jgi:hypothetical protein
MPRLLEIISKAYSYTRNHKYLWFFGLFLTFCGALNFIRLIDWSALLTGEFVFLLLLGLVTLFVSFILIFLAAISRSVIIYTVLHLERKEDVSMKMALKDTKKHWSTVFLASLFIFSILLFIFSWLFLPVYLMHPTQDVYKPLLITLIGLAIFLPILVSLMLVNFFAACFIVVYNMSVWRSIQSAFDLFMRYWERMIGLFVFLVVIYLVLFSFSASLIGLCLLFAYQAQSLVQSLSIPLIIGIFSLLSLSLLFANALVNVFTNVAWTLYFLKIVKAKRFPELEDEAPIVEPAI